MTSGRVDAAPRIPWKLGAAAVQTRGSADLPPPRAACAASGTLRAPTRRTRAWRWGRSRGSMNAPPAPKDDYGAVLERLEHALDPDDVLAPV